MNIIERGISLIAPHVCILCGLEGTLLCEPCSSAQLDILPSRCYRCHEATKQSQVCKRCRRITPISHAWVAAEYQDIAKMLVHKLKFERASSAADHIAELIDFGLPLLPPTVVLTHIPTANSRVRARGYDQAHMIAKTLASRRNWRYAPLLIRNSSFRQLGATRKQRFKQLEHAFAAQNLNIVRDAHILLIDDVLTTGATVEAAAGVLKAAGAKTIDVAVFAQP